MDAFMYSFLNSRSAQVQHMLQSAAAYLCLVYCHVQLRNPCQSQVMVQSLQRRLGHLREHHRRDIQVLLPG